jgi:heptosyltransferase II
MLLFGAALRSPLGMDHSVQPPPQRIVVKEVNWLGDLVMSLPALHAIRRSFPRARISVVTKSELASFFDGVEWIDEVIPYTVRRGIRGRGDRRAVVNTIRSRGFDLAVLFPNSFESALWVWMARIPRRAGYIRDLRGLMLTHKIAPPPEAMNDHQVHYWLTMLQQTIGVSGDPRDFALTADPNRLQEMAAWLHAHRRRKGSPLIAIAPAAAFGPAKEWPTMHFVQLINDLAERHDAECVLVGAPDDRPQCATIASASRHGALVAAGETNVGQLVALLKLADGFVGNDSGAMHVAAALGQPTVGIFGSTNPARTGPLGPRTRVLWQHLICSPCLARTCRFGHYNCLREITPGGALGALHALGAIQ